MSGPPPLQDSQRPVITGIGVLNGAAVGVDAFWARLIDTTPQPTNTTLASFDPKQWLDRRVRRHSDPFAQMAAAAAALAIDDAGWDRSAADPDTTGVVLGTGNGSASTQVREYLNYLDEGPAGVTPLLGVLTMSNASSSVVALQVGARGPTHCISSGCASSTHAVGEAARLIRLGVCETVFTGGAESFYAAGRGQDERNISEAMLAGLGNLKVLTHDSVSRPFDERRDGFVLADGSCVMVLERLDHARARGARIYAEVCGYGNTNDALDLIAPAEDGSGVRRAMEQALREAGEPVSSVGLVNTHGTATGANDLTETRGIRDLFGDPGPAVNSTKGATGHAGPAAGGIEAASVALAIHHRMIPPTAGLERPDPAIDVDLVYGAPRPWPDPHVGLSTSLGLGGHNGCVALRRID